PALLRNEPHGLRRGRSVPAGEEHMPSRASEVTGTLKTDAGVSTGHDCDIPSHNAPVLAETRRPALDDHHLGPPVERVLQPCPDRDRRTPDILDDPRRDLVVKHDIHPAVEACVALRRSSPPGGNWLTRCVSPI